MLATLLLAPTPLTCELVGPLDRLVPALARETGLPLSVSPNVADEVACLALKGADPEETLARLASAVGATWREEAGGMRRLWRTPDQERAQNAESRRLRAAAFRKALDERTEQPFDAKMAAIRLRAFQEAGNSPRMYTEEIRRTEAKTRSGTPAGRLADALLREFGPDGLADLPRTGRFVFSDRPTAAQIRFPFDARPWIARAEREMTTWRDAARGLEERILVQGGQPVPPSDRPVAKTLLVLTPHREGGVGFQVVLADDRLGVVAQSRGEIAGPPILSRLRDNVVLPGVSVIRQNPVADAFFAREDPEAAPVPPDVAARLNDPVAHEPLGYLLGDALFQYARASGTNLVGRLDDAAYADVWAFWPGPLAVPAFLRRIGQRHELRRREGWTEVVPRDPAAASEDRIPRAALALITAAATRVAPLGLDGLAALSWRLRAYDGRPLAEAVYRFARQGDPARWGGFSQPGLRCYGSLTRDQLPLARRHDRLLFRDLRADQREFLTRTVYERDYLSVNGPARGIESEPTERWSNGVPPNASLFVMDSTEYAVDTPSEGLSLGDYAEAAYKASRPRIFPSGTFRSFDPAKVRPLRRREVFVQLRETDWKASWMGGAFGVEHLGAFGRAEAFPKEFRRALAEETAKLEKRYASSYPGMIRPPTPPKPAVIPP